MAPSRLLSCRSFHRWLFLQPSLSVARGRSEVSSGAHCAIGVACRMRVIETPIVTASLRKHLNDEAYRALQLPLVLRPEHGALIRGGERLRKLRWGAEGRGKRGGVRTIDYGAVEDAVCFMLFMFAKNQQGDLTQKQLKELARAMREEFK